MEAAETMSFDMNPLRNNLPKNRRGLSRCYSGKARSFKCMAHVHCLEDLKKTKHCDTKKRKKYSERRDLHVNTYTTCRRVSSSSPCSTPNYVGFLDN